MKDTIQKLNDVLGHLTAMSFMRPETSEDLEKPLNVLSEAISEFENLDIPIVSQQRELLYAVCDELALAIHKHPLPPSLKSLVINKVLADNCG